MKTTVVAQTSKGHRIWLQGLFSQGIKPMDRYNVVYMDNAIVLSFMATGKRKVTDSKGGVIDLEGKRVTQWARGATHVTVSNVDATGTIIIQRGVA